MKKMMVGMVLAMLMVGMCGCSAGMTTLDPVKAGTKAESLTAESESEMETEMATEMVTETSAAETEPETKMSAVTATEPETDCGDPDDAAVDYPGADVVEIVNARGDLTTVYKLADGRYMNRSCDVFTYDGKEAWYDQNGVEWNEALNSGSSAKYDDVVPGKEVAEVYPAESDLEVVGVDYGDPDDIENMVMKAPEVNEGEVKESLECELEIDTGDPDEVDA